MNNTSPKRDMDINEAVAIIETAMNQNAAPVEAASENGFASMNLPRALMSSLEHMKYTNPTPVQAQAIPAAMKGKDVLGSAQTGTGKTGAFIIPILARLMTDLHSSALIMTPTRELASQILVVARQMMHTNNTIKTALLIGGESMGRQLAQLSAKPRLVIGTPGRINDHLRTRSNIFSTTNILVLDEADRMLDMGFTPQINEVIKHIKTPNRQTLMFSATFPEAIIKFTKTYMNDPIRVTIEPERTSAANIIHESINTTEKTRYSDLTNELHNRKGSIILFIKTKHGADRMAKKLEDDGHSVDVIHGGLSQRQRDRAIASFRAKKTRVMVATDVAARGLDVPHIEHVINYDLPQVAEDYVHRIGRTARNGQEGRALSFLMPSEKGKWNAIQRILNPGQKQERGGRGEGRGHSGSNGGQRRQHSGGNNRPQNRSFGHTDREFEQQTAAGEPQQRPQRDNGFQKRREERSSFQPRVDEQSQDAVFQSRSQSGYNKPRSNDGFKPRSEGGFKQRSEGGFKPRGGDGFKGRPDVAYQPRNDGGYSEGYKGGNNRPQPSRATPVDNEPNFNREGAGGENRFNRDADKPFQRKDGPSKPHGQFHKKKKFFSKNKNSRGSSAA